MQEFDIFSNLPNDPLAAAELLCAEYYNNYANSNAISRITIIDYFYQFTKYCKTHGLDLSYPSLKDLTINDAAIRADDFLESTLLKLKEASIDQFVHVAKSKIGLTKEEKLLIEQQIISIRTTINASTTISEENKARLLSALNLLQQELDKPIGDFFVWFGKLGMLNSLAKDFVDTLQPVFDCVNKIYKIVKRFAPDNISLPSGGDYPSLPPGNDV